MDVRKQSLELFGFGVRIAREKKGISQEKLSELAGLDRNYVGRIERGQQNLGLENIIKLALVLDVEPQQLFRFFTRSALSRMRE